MEDLIKLIDSVAAEKFSDANAILKEKLDAKVAARRDAVYKQFDEIARSHPLHELAALCESKESLPIKIRTLAQAAAKCDNIGSVLEAVVQATSPQISQAEAEMTRMQYPNPFTPDHVEMEGCCIRAINDELFKSAQWRSALKAFHKADYDIRASAYNDFVYQYCDAITSTFNAVKNLNISTVYNLINNNYAYLDALCKKYC
jgi:hypothetical protein